MQSESMLSESNIVHVMLLMSGGHQYELSLTSDAPLLRELFQSLTNRSENAGNPVLKIPSEEDGSCLYIPRESIVAIATDPPVQVQQMELKNPAIQTEQAPEPLPAQIIESAYVQLDNFLPPESYQRLLQSVFPNESAVESSSIHLPTPESFAPCRQLILDRVGAVLPDVLNSLGIPGFSLPFIEAVPVPNHDCEPQKTQRDNDGSENGMKVLSFIYYFYQEPQPFTGGELLIYDSKSVNGVVSDAESFKTVEPRNNSIVFFFSNYTYEMLPMNPKSPAFSDRCFRVKGWLRR